MKDKFCNMNQSNDYLYYFWFQNVPLIMCQYLVQIIRHAFQGLNYAMALMIAEIMWMKVLITVQIPARSFMLIQMV